MNFRIAGTFTDSLAQLTGDEQKAVKTTAFDLQINPVNPGMSLHKLDKTMDKNFWSVRVSRDIRLIVHKTPASLLLCFVAHHDQAYHWAERRKLEVHPTTGAAQFVEIRERVEQISVPVYVPSEAPAVSKPVLFARHTDDELLGYGVPPEWLADVRAANEDTLLELVDHLPAEAAEALIELATGGTPQVQRYGAPDVRIDPFDHPDAQRRFRVMNDMDELERAFAYPWDKWTIFLHPAQRDWVTQAFNGPARVSGSAGTGKTIVALHRAAHLARTNPDARVWLGTFSPTLARALHHKLKLLLSSELRLGERIEVYAVDTMAERLHEAHFGPRQQPTREQIESLLTDAATAYSQIPFSASFLSAEWRHVVDAWQLASWEAIATCGAPAAARVCRSRSARRCGQFLSRYALNWTSRVW